MSNLDGAYAFRDRLSQLLIDDLMGPVGGDDELIDDAPITRYATGILYPAGGGWKNAGLADASQDVDEADGYDELANPDPAVAMANVKNPASMGLTFSIREGSCDSLFVHVRAARYEPQPHEDPDMPPRWRRVPLRIQPIPIDIATPVTQGRSELGEGLVLFRRIRPVDSTGAIGVTLVLINERKPTGRLGLRDADAIFQPELSVLPKNGVAPVFVERDSLATGSDDDETASNELLFSHVPNLAVGHGCAVDWKLNSSNSADTLRTTFTPIHDLRLADSNPQLNFPALDMRYLDVAPRDELVRELGRVVAAYREWIARQMDALEDPSTRKGRAGQRHLDQCRDAATRLEHGIELLASDEQCDALLAFRLMNAAMIEQRIRSERILKGRTDLQPAEIPAQWRPFQLAFVLLCLTGIIDEDSEDRSIADLLWFPTGGGKTEAYLGLIAYAIFLRRLTGRGTGVTALMRYTLRLLTIQQFERAALLICCCEAIRRGRNDLGTEEISIGLYVGRSATPLTRPEAGRALEKLRRNPNAVPKEGNPVQFRSCPWCGTKLDPYKYWIGNSPPRLNISCKNESCEFSKRLPVFLVDDDLYDFRPSLIIGTVDKFAGLPWRSKASRLFNRDRSGGAGIDLIIQDELHLISGPLGTLTGLYETAVDDLAGRDGKRPKVIASTATIRRAPEQGRALFDRTVLQFPPPGLDSRDSYFAVEAPPERKGTRRYVGVMAPGKSQTTLLVRVYSALLQFAQDIDGEAKARDPYWTLVGYFNSLRVLAGARMQVQDDVEGRIAQLAPDEKSRRRLDDPIELTSRATSVDIPGYLQRMRLELPNADTLDVILATNMISVGVDIDRLGLMAVMGQPQSTSEYIQSTSRVGRQHPGLVVTMYNAARSRDRSHYESFIPYHSALYRQVESTSVTPFSPRARDRGLHAVLIALARHTVDGLRENGDAVNIVRHRPEVEALRDRILQRVEQIEPAEVRPTREELDQVISTWVRRAEAERNLVYSNFQEPERGLLIEASEDAPELNQLFPTLWSLRDVDRSSNLYLVRQ